jgi:guanylate kinase
MNKPLYLFVGKSASGKTTIAELLESKYNYKTLQSYTTRPKRHENETGHTFISEKEFSELENIIAYTEYNGYKYCATQNQIDEVSIYVIDVPGIETLLKKYKTERPVVIVYFDTSIVTRIDRMIERGSSDMEIVSRLRNDEASDWFRDIKKLCGESDNRHPAKVYTIDANQNVNNVLKQIGWIMEAVTYDNLY